jgi:hypothetical protein
MPILCPGAGAPDGGKRMAPRSSARSAVQKKRFQMDAKRMLKTVILWKCDQKKETERYENYER